MRYIVLAFALLSFAGCLGDDPASSELNVEPTAPEPGAAPEPVSIHERLERLEGLDRTWTFQVGPDHTTATIKASMETLEGYGDGGPHTADDYCFRMFWNGPDGAGESSYCTSGGTNVNLQLGVQMGDRTFANIGRADVGTWTIKMASSPGLGTFIIDVEVA